MVEQLVQSKLVLLGEMGSGKTSLVQRFVRGQYFENQVGVSGWVSRRSGQRGGGCEPPAAAATAAALDRPAGPSARRSNCVHHCLQSLVQESTIGASFFTKTIPEKHVKFEIWWVVTRRSPLWCGEWKLVVVWRGAAAPGRPPPSPSQCARRSILEGARRLLGYTLPC